MIYRRHRMDGRKPTLESNHRNHMRHSSWTLFLVPLALPLVLLLFPGARRTLEGGNSDARPAYEHVEEQNPSLSGSSGLPAAGPDQSTTDEETQSGEKA
jgi:hypothetical protein